MWDKKRKILEKRLKSNPPVCPRCNGNMDFGYLNQRYIRWQKKGDIRDNYDYPWLASIPYAIPSYNCKDCHLVIGQYKFKSQNKIFSNQSTKLFEYCPYCKYKLNMGYTFSNWRISFDKRVHVSVGKTLSFSQVPWPNKKLPTKKCRNCGTFILRYKR